MKIKTIPPPAVEATVQIELSLSDARRLTAELDYRSKTNQGIGIKMDELRRELMNHFSGELL